MMKENNAANESHESFEFIPDTIATVSAKYTQIWWILHTIYTENLALGFWSAWKKKTTFYYIRAHGNSIAK